MIGANIGAATADIIMKTGAAEVYFSKLDDLLLDEKLLLDFIVCLLVDFTKISVDDEIVFKIYILKADIFLKNLPINCSRTCF